MKFHIFASGDRTCGDGDHYATVDIPYMNTDDKEYVREELRAVFGRIFDSPVRSVRVKTDAENKENDDAG